MRGCERLGVSLRWSVSEIQVKNLWRDERVVLPVEASWNSQAMTDQNDVFDAGEPAGRGSSPDYVRQALDGFSAGHKQARRAARKAAPRVESACAEVVRDCSYVVAFGVTFGALLAADLIPRLVRAGACGGRDAAVRAWKARRGSRGGGGVREIPVSS
jgi:hypothetical protein